MDEGIHEGWLVVASLAGVGEWATLTVTGAESEAEAIDFIAHRADFCWGSQGWKFKASRVAILADKTLQFPNPHLQLESQPPTPPVAKSAAG